MMGTGACRGASAPDSRRGSRWALATAILPATAASIPRETKLP